MFKEISPFCTIEINYSEILNRLLRPRRANRVHRELQTDENRKKDKSREALQMAAGTSQALFYNSVKIRGNILGLLFLKKKLDTKPPFVPLHIPVVALRALTLCCWENRPWRSRTFFTTFLPGISCILPPLTLAPSSKDDARETFLGKISRLHLINGNNNLAELLVPPLWLVTPSDSFITFRLSPPAFPFALKKQLFLSRPPPSALRRPLSVQGSWSGATSQFYDKTGPIKNHPTLVRKIAALKVNSRGGITAPVRPTQRPRWRSLGKNLRHWNASRRVRNPQFLSLFEKVKSLNGRQKRGYFPASLKGATWGAGTLLKAPVPAGKEWVGNFTRDVF